jgi:microcystin-dependent protein
MKTLILIVALLGFSEAKAQVGINTQNPDPTSVLDLMANDKGLLIPRLSTAQRQALTTAPPANSLLVFDTDLKAFFYFNAASGVWLAMNPLQAQMRNAADSIISAYKLRVENDLVVTGNSQTLGTVKATNFEGDGIVPAGGIIIWSGSAAAVPAGWNLCNGSNGTPDLRERFVVGAGGDNPSVVGAGYALSANGGSNQVALTVNEMPSHSHTIVDPGHAHTFRMGRETFSGANQYGLASMNSSDLVVNPNTSNGDTAPGIKYQPGSAVMNNTTGISINATGNGQPHENRPPYFALCYIMKL